MTISTDAKVNASVLKQKIKSFPMGEKGTKDYNKEFQLICNDLEIGDFPKVHEYGFKCLDEEWKNVKEKLNSTK